jgi:hypothetical protein
MLGVLSDTDYCTRNTVSVLVDACPGDTMSFSTCSNLNPDQDLTDHFIRLFQQGKTPELAYADGNPSGWYCAELTYVVPSSTINVCSTFALNLGCWDGLSCQMTATVDIIHSFPHTTGTLLLRFLLLILFFDRYTSSTNLTHCTT